MDVPENITVVLDEVTKFTWHDYSLFMLMLVSSAAIGIYFGCFGKKQSTAEEYLLGGKEMSVFPIAMSLIASYISGITILAVPADVYRYGATYGLLVVMFIFIMLAGMYVFLPVFHKLQLTSSYEYLNLRFDQRLRSLASLLFAIHMLLYLPIVIYVPALALAQGTGFNVHHITPVVCGVCIFYTTIGGLKAVVWTDTVQIILMIGSTIAITIMGTVYGGGVQEIIRASWEGGRLDLDFDIDPTKRDTFWIVTIGVSLSWLSIVSTSQGCIQKCLALPTMADVKKALIIFGVGMMAFVGISVFSGLMIYNKYKDCDPFSSKQITEHDQILPLYVIQVAGSVPGLPGLFIAGVFSAALSSLSAAMNSLACTLYEDFISARMAKDISPKRVSNILKWIVAIIGIVCTLLVFVVERLGMVLQLGFSLSGITQGPTLGLFCLGMLAPSANANGALYGGFGSLLIMTWIVGGSQYYKMNKLIVYNSLPVSTEACHLGQNFTMPVIDSHVDPDWQPFYLYRLSYYYYTLIGFILVFVIALPVSWMTKKDTDKSVQQDLISPVMHWLIRDKKQPPPDYCSVDKAFEFVKQNVE